MQRQQTNLLSVNFGHHRYSNLNKDTFRDLNQDKIDKLLEGNEGLDLRAPAWEWAQLGGVARL